MEKFMNREQAGILLAEKLKKYQGSNSVVLAIPRGGVPVGYVIAKLLQLPLDIILSKKIGHPSNPEYAIGAVSAGSVIIAPNINVPDNYIEQEIAKLQKQIQEKYDYFKKGKKPLDISGKNVILVDDGIATGRTLMASIEMLRKQNPLKIIVAAPVVPLNNVPEINQRADEFIYLLSPQYFSAVGQFYDDFTQTEDEEVIRLLNEENISN
jgi:putative phosphoribosyl transferase